MPLYDPIHDTMITVEVPDVRPDTKSLHTNNENDIDNNGAGSHESTATTTEEEPPQTTTDEERTGSLLKHILAPNPRSTPSKRSKKSRGVNIRGVTVLSSARSRHLKKEDGQPFWRKDIQYAFLKALFDNNVKAFTDPFPDSPDNVNMDDREHDPEGRLSFAELYIKSISHSSKCSKVLKERLLNDMKMSIPTCMICLLVNVGRMNTTINFVPDMKSQLRTYHPIPSLQVNYDSSTTGNDKSNDKQLQDTPRLKSILKACCDDTHEPQDLEKLETLDKLPMTTVVNMIFVLCNSEEAVMKKFFSDTPYYFFDIFINSSYDPRSRSDLFLWLLYNYMETHMTEEDMSKNPFGATKPALRQAVMDHDIDSPMEKEFGERLHDQRVKYLEEEGPDKPPMLKTDGTMTWKLSDMDSRPANIQRVEKPHDIDEDDDPYQSDEHEEVAHVEPIQQEEKETEQDEVMEDVKVEIDAEKVTTSVVPEKVKVKTEVSPPLPTKKPQKEKGKDKNKEKEKEKEREKEREKEKEKEKTPAKKASPGTPSTTTTRTTRAATSATTTTDTNSTATTATSNASSSLSTTTSASTAAQPVLRQDIDVSNIRKVLKGLRQRSEKKRFKQGVIKHEDFLIHREGTVDDDASNRLRLKNYKGDYGEYHTKFHKLFNKLKNGFYEEILKDEVNAEVKEKVEFKYTEEDDDEPLKLKSFSL